MIFRKQIEKIESEKVKCDECKHWVDKEDAQEITHESYYDDFFSQQTIDYYCPMHKKPYEVVKSYIGGDIVYSKLIPEHYIEVNEKGQEIKKK